MSWLRRLFYGERPSAVQHDADDDLCARCEPLEMRYRDLERRLQDAEDRLRERGALLYELQQHYSAEHFGFQESMRNLNIERLRNAGAFADRDVLIARAKLLQSRIQELKERLRRHEPVEEQEFDQSPILIEKEPP
jgi:hypothetical protein